MCWFAKSKNVIFIPLNISHYFLNLSANIRSLVKNNAFSSGPSLNFTEDCSTYNIFLETVRKKFHNILYIRSFILFFTLAPLLFSSPERTPIWRHNLFCFVWSKIAFNIFIFLFFTNQSLTVITKPISRFWIWDDFIVRTLYTAFNCNDWASHFLPPYFQLSGIPSASKIMSKIYIKISPLSPSPPTFQQK